MNDNFDEEIIIVNNLVILQRFQLKIMNQILLKTTKKKH